MRSIAGTGEMCSTRSSFVLFTGWAGASSERSSGKIAIAAKKRSIKPARAWTRIVVMFDILSPVFYTGTPKTGDETKVREVTVIP
jgi:hypothetical protein